jgi:hypothetical protein
LQRHHVNECLCTRLKQIYNLPGYRGPPPPIATFSSPVIASSSELHSAAMRFLTLLRAHLWFPQSQQPGRKTMLTVTKAVKTTSCPMTRMRMKCYG